MKKITIAIAGLGSRGLDTYARCLERYPDRAELVAIADIRPDRVQVAAERYHGECSFTANNGRFVAVILLDT